MIIGKIAPAIAATKEQGTNQKRDSPASEPAADRLHLADGQQT
jgi:hypothetical protein